MFGDVGESVRVELEIQLVTIITGTTEKVLVNHIVGVRTRQQCLSLLGSIDFTGIFWYGWSLYDSRGGISISNMLGDGQKNTSETARTGGLTQEYWIGSAGSHRSILCPLLREHIYHLNPCISKRYNSIQIAEGKSAQPITISEIRKRYIQ